MILFNGFLKIIFSLQSTVCLLALWSRRLTCKSKTILQFSPIKPFRYLMVCVSNIKFNTAIF